MARIQTFLPFDQTTLDFSEMYFGDSYFFNNSYVRMDGRSYEDMALVSFDSGDLSFVVGIGGHGLRANAWGEVVSGTITGLFEGVGLNSEAIYDRVYLTGISISGAEFYRAMTTLGTQDDQALLGRALAGNDRFDLGAYADHAQGRGGHDTMYGNGGNDTLDGGMGQDVMYGGAGADVFVLKSVAELGRTEATTDTISDFTRGMDRIDLSAIDATSGVAGNQAFVFVGRNGFGTSARGEVAIQHFDRAGTSNDVTLVRIDTDADRDAEAIIRLTGLHSLTASDFLL